MSKITNGDIFQLGEHVLACGDARNNMIAAKAIGGKKISLVLTDVPYGVSYTASKRGISKIHKQKEILNDQFQTDEEYILFTRCWLSVIKPYLTQKNSVYIFNSDKMIFALREALLDEGFRFAQLLIWVKNNSVMGRLNYLAQHELIAYGWYGSHIFHKSKDKSVIFYPKPNKSLLHPTMKPIGLLRRLILNSSKIGDYVYDCFLGSGSTLIACEQTKRKCIGIELDPEYCQTTIDRWEKLTGGKAVQIGE